MFKIGIQVDELVEKICVSTTLNKTKDWALVQKREQFMSGGALTSKSLVLVIVTDFLRFHQLTVSLTLPNTVSLERD